MRTDGAYGVIGPNTIGRIATSIKRRFSVVLIYYEGSWIDSMDFRKLLRFRKGGMKKVLEEEMAAQTFYV